MLATIMQTLDTTIANVALPHIQGSLAATQDQITWVLTSYIIASALMTLPIGWLSGRYGSKLVFATSIIGFTVASGLCGIAQSITEMVLFRLIQGLFGAALVPLSQAILLDITPKEKHGATMALWGMGVMIGPILGPTLGGYLTEYYNWRWVFYINIPIGIIAFLGVMRFLHESERSDRVFDTFGFVTLAIFIAALQLILDRGEQVDWFNSKEILFYAAVSVSGLWMFLVHTYYTNNPFLSGELFVDRNYVMALIFIFFVGIILLATMALLPPYMQNIMGYSVIDTGVLMAPRGIGTMVAMMIVGRVTGKIDARALIFLGMSLTAWSLYDMTTFTDFVPQNKLVIVSIVQGFGLGFIFVPLSTLAFATLSNKLRAEGAGLFSLVRNLGSSIGVSIVTALFSRNMQRNHAYLGEHLTPFNTSTWKAVLPDSLHLSQAAPFEILNAEVTKQAAVISYIDDFKFMLIIVLLSIPMIFFLRKPENTAAMDEPATIMDH